MSESLPEHLPFQSLFDVLTSLTATQACLLQKLTATEQALVWEKHSHSLTRCGSLTMPGHMLDQMTQIRDSIIALNSAGKNCQVLVVTDDDAEVPDDSSDPHLPSTQWKNSADN